MAKSNASPFFKTFSKSTIHVYAIIGSPSGDIDGGPESHYLCLISVVCQGLHSVQ